VSLLQIDRLRIEFALRQGTEVAVDDVSLSLEPGEILGLVGESGAGKSTVGNGVIDLVAPPGYVAGGEIRLDGRRISGLDEEAMRALRGAEIGFIFQDPMTSLNPVLTVETQLVETLLANGDIDETAAQQRAVEMLAAVGIPEPADRIKQYPHQFSGGMRQRVVIAIALAAEPKLIIADEPTTALDVSIQDQILKLIQQLCKERGVGVLLVTHDMGVIATVADRVAVMYRGRLMEEGPTRQILERPEHPYTKSLISAVPRTDVKLRRFPQVDYIDPITVNGGQMKRIDIASHWLGADRDQQLGGDAILQVRDVSLRFVTRHALLEKNRRYVQAAKAVSFDVLRGETFGLVGESGSGKSTIARIIAGLQKPGAGSIRFDGRELVGLRSRAEWLAVHRKMQMVFQNPYSSMNPRLRVGDIIAEPIRFHKLADSRAQIDAIVADLLDHVGLGAPAASRFPHEFSGGQRQRISIARALASRPKFLICDEPTSALDVSVQAQILNLLKDLQSELGLTMLFISHDLPVIRQMCDRIGVMQHGALLEVAETEQLFEQPEHPYSRDLLALMPKLEGLSLEGLELEEAGN